MKNNGSKQPPASDSVGIVGAGFSGLLLSIALARLGYSVSVFEEHKEPGIPPHCTGIVSSKTVSLIEEILNKDIPSRLVRRKLQGLIVCSQESGRCIKLRVREGLAMLDRPALDRYLAQESSALGASIYYNTLVTSASPNGILEIKGGSRLRFKAIILAEGAKPRLRADLKLGTIEQPGYGVNYVVDCNEYLSNTNTVVEKDFATIVFGHNFSPGYAWIIPYTKETCIVGVASKSLDKVLGLLRTLKPKPRYSYGGRLYIGHNPRWRVRLRRLLVFGDAAGLDKPLSGGGLYPQSNAIHYLIKKLKNKKNDKNLLQTLEKSIKNTIKEIKKSVALSKLLLEKPDIARCILEILNHEIEISEYDNHYRTAIELMDKVHASSLLRSCGVIVPLQILTKIFFNIKYFLE
jgi:flavin-dependent dehydrogenase